MTQGGGMGVRTPQEALSPLMPLRISDSCIALIAVAVALRRN